MIGLTRIYKVNGHYVVAHSIEDAVSIYKEAENLGPGDDITSCVLLAPGRHPDFAYIRKPDTDLKNK